MLEQDGDQNTTLELDSSNFDSNVQQLFLLLDSAFFFGKLRGYCKVVSHNDWKIRSHCQGRTTRTDGSTRIDFDTQNQELNEGKEENQRRAKR